MAAEHQSFRNAPQTAEHRAISPGPAYHETSSTDQIRTSNTAAVDVGIVTSKFESARLGGGLSQETPAVIGTSKLPRKREDAAAAGDKKQANDEGESSDDDDKLGTERFDFIARKANKAIKDRDWPKAKEFVQSMLTDHILASKAGYDPQTWLNILFGVELRLQNWAAALATSQGFIATTITKYGGMIEYDQAYAHMNLGDWASAKRSCKRSIKVRRKLNSKSKEYNESITLMIAIVDGMGDATEVEFYQSLLQPPQATSPQFDASNAAPVIVQEDSKSTQERNKNHELLRNFNKQVDEQGRLFNLRLDSNGRNVHGTKYQINDAIGKVVLANDFAMGRLLFNDAHIRETILETSKDDIHTVWQYRPIHYAVKRNRTEMLKILLDLGANVLSMTAYHGNALHIAAYRGGVQSARLLLDSRSPINRLSGHGETALCIAIKRKRLHMVDYLISRGANVNTNGFGWARPLSIAAQGIGPYEMTLSLLKAGARIEGLSPESQGTALHIAASRNVESIVRLLLEWGADENAKDKYGRTPRDRATSTAVLKLLE